MLRPDFMKMNPFFEAKKMFKGVVGGYSFDLGEDFVDFRAYLDE